MSSRIKKLKFDSKSNSCQEHKCIVIFYTSRCDEQKSPLINIFKEAKSGKLYKIGQFCKKKSLIYPNDHEIVAKFEHKLRYQLQNWDGKQLVFRFNPLRISMRDLYGNEEASNHDKNLKIEARITTSDEFLNNYQQNFTDDYQSIGKDNTIILREKVRA